MVTSGFLGNWCVFLNGRAQLSSHLNHQAWFLVQNEFLFLFPCFISYLLFSATTSTSPCLVILLHIILFFFLTNSEKPPSPKWGSSFTLISPWNVYLRNHLINSLRNRPKNDIAYLRWWKKWSVLNSLEDLRAVVLSPCFRAQGCLCCQTSPAPGSQLWGSWSQPTRPWTRPTSHNWPPSF